MLEQVVVHQLCLAHPTGIPELLINHSWNCCSSQLQRLRKTKPEMALFSYGAMKAEWLVIEQQVLCLRSTGRELLC